MTFTLAFPEPLPPAAVFYKYGPTAAIPTPHRYQLPATTTGNTVTFSITDGGLGDDDLTANGAIVSRGGPVEIAVASPTITLTLASPLTGVGQAVGGTIALGSAAPAGGLQVTLASSSSGVATVAPSPVTITAGTTTGAFTVTGVALGTATITGTAAGYSNGTVDIDVTGSVIAVGNVMTVPGQTQAFPVTLGTPAPAGGVTVNLTSGNTSVVTVPASVFIAAGATAPAANPVATGVAPGTATITANAIGYAPGNGSATIIAVPVQITVTNANDSGAGSLRDAIALANLSPDLNTIDLQGVTGPIVLTSGQINISGPLTIVGPGANNLTIDGNANSRIFAIFATDPACPALDGPDYLVSISGVRLTNARRTTSNAGGAIFSEHSLALDSVTVDNNKAGNGGGVAYLIQYPGQSLTISNSHFLNNTVQPLTGPVGVVGGAVNIAERCATRTTPAPVNISNSVFSGNRAEPLTLNGNGGAIFANSYADITISDTRIVDNHVDVPNPPPAGQTYRAGGIYAKAKSLRIERSEIADNTINDATSSDQARGGGLAVFNGTPDLQAPGDAMTVRIINSTISGNAVSATAGAMHVYGNVAIELDNSTVSNNAAANGRTGGFWLTGGATDPPSASNATAPTLKLISSIIANSSANTADVATSTSDFPSFTIDATNSLIETICSTCNISVSGTGNLIATDPLLGPLADNGGPTRRHALLAGVRRSMRAATRWP